MEFTTEKYRVERIVGKQKFEGKLFYLVKWFGYPEEKNTWEPLENCVEAKPLILEFEANCLREQRGKSSGGTGRQRTSKQYEHLCSCDAGSSSKKVTVPDGDDNLEKKAELLDCCDHQIEILGAIPRDPNTLTLGVRMRGKTKDEDICYFDKNEVALLWPFSYISFLEERIVFRFDDEEK